MAINQTLIKMEETLNGSTAPVGFLPIEDYKELEHGETDILLGYSPEWVNEDFNPKGIRECFKNDLGDNGWVSARWIDYHDSYKEDRKSIPTHFLSLRHLETLDKSLVACKDVVEYLESIISEDSELHDLVHVDTVTNGSEVISKGYDAVNVAYVKEALNSLKLLSKNKVNSLNGWITDEKPKRKGISRLLVILEPGYSYTTDTCSLIKDVCKDLPIVALYNSEHKEVPIEDNKNGIYYELSVQDTYLNKWYSPTWDKVKAWKYLD